MSHRYAARLAIMISLLSLAAVARAADPPPCPGPENPGCVWKSVNVVTVQFNPSLDAALEQVRLYRDPANPALIRAFTLGDADTRWACFQKAVDAWNVALTNLCGVGKTPFQLQAVKNNGDWGTKQTVPAVCMDAGLANPDDPTLPHLPATGDDVFDRQAAYLGDGKNVTSTGYGGFKTPAIDPGWIVGNGVGTYTVDARLGETYPRCDADSVGKMLESDIAWFTHLEDAGACKIIGWDYRYAPDAANPNDPGNPVPYKAAVGKPGPDAFDFYSVMLHELGHLLGLGHMNDPAGKNVMIGQLAPGDRQVISNTEIACLRTLYCNQATPAKRSTWGALKTLYR